MAAKFDKELLKKHHFWFLFIPVGIFLLMTWYTLMAEVPDAIETKDAKNKDEKKANTAAKVQARKAVDEYGKQLVELDGHRQRMWKEGWAEQKDLYVWPKGYSEAQKKVVKDRKFGDEIPEQEAAARDQFRDPKVYAAEYKALIDTVQPMQFRESWDKVLRYIGVWGRFPSSEDIWLAMEDLWVQREILLAIHQVNVNAAHFTLEPPAKSEVDKPLQRRFKSRFWQADLEVASVKGKQVLKGKLTNVSGRLLVLGIGNTMKLRVMFGANAFIFEIQGDSVEADTELVVPYIESRHTIPAEWKVDRIDGVEQIFDARTVPIKRVEYMVLGQLSDRTKDYSMKMALFSEEQAKKDKEAFATIGGKDGNDTETRGGQGPPLSQNGLPRYRYIDATETVRRLPLGFVVTTDQSFMKDIVESILNLRLRLQITQLNWVRFHGVLNYAPSAATDLVVKRKDNTAFGGAPTNSRDDQFSANLMEISVYGIISLFEQHPDEKGPPKLPIKK